MKKTKKKLQHYLVTYFNRSNTTRYRSYYVRTSCENTEHCEITRTASDHKSNHNIMFNMIWGYDTHFYSVIQHMTRALLAWARARHIVAIFDRSSHSLLLSFCNTVRYIRLRLFQISILPCYRKVVYCRYLVVLLQVKSSCTRLRGHRLFHAPKEKDIIVVHIFVWFYNQSTVSEIMNMGKVVRCDNDSDSTS